MSVVLQSDILNALSSLPITGQYTPHWQTSPDLARKLHLPSYVCHQDNRISQPDTANMTKMSIWEHCVGLLRCLHLEATWCLAVSLSCWHTSCLTKSSWRRTWTLCSQHIDHVWRVIMTGDLNCKHCNCGNHFSTHNGIHLQRDADLNSVMVIDLEHPIY